MLIKQILASLTALTLFDRPPVTAHKQCIAPATMTGVWRADDGGTYYVRESGRVVWWVGMSRDSGRSWTNVFNGVRNGATVTGTWVDVPHGKTRGGGTLNLRVDGSRGVLGFNRTEASGGFAGKRWYQPCNDTY